MPYSSIEAAKKAGFPTTAENIVFSCSPKLCKCGCGQPTKIIKCTNRKRGLIKGEYLDYVNGHNNRGKHYNVGKTPWNKNLTVDTDERVKLGIEKSTKTIRNQYKNGRISWNMGSTKETDDRVKKQAETRIKLGLSKGEKNPSYIDGKSEERHPYSWSEWQKIAENVRKRDNHVCQLCNKTEKENGKKLSVHHIIPYRIIGVHNMENVITLCVGCHNKVERRKNAIFE